MKNHKKPLCRNIKYEMDENILTADLLPPKPHVVKITIGGTEMDDDLSSHGAFESDTLEDVESELKEPDMYRVILHNDHYTTMEFVVEVIMKVFHKPVIEATKIMMDVHQKGRASVGVYPYDIASTKVNQVTQLARQKEFPLLCTIEKE